MFFREGNKFPPIDERLILYDRNTRLFDGIHREVFLEETSKFVGIYPNSDFWRYADTLAFGKTISTFKEKTSTIGYVQLNFIRLMAEIFADLIFGKGLNIRVDKNKNQKFLDELVERSKFNHLIYETLLALSYLGDTCFKLQKDEFGEISILEVKPENYFPAFSRSDSRKVVSATETTVIKFGDKQFLFQQTHVPGIILYAANRLDHGTVGESVDPLSLFFSLYPNPDEPWVETRVDSILLYHIPNFRKLREYWGESDISKSILAMQGELNNRLTQVAAVLDKHANPKMIVPEGVLDKNKRAINEDMEFFEMRLLNPMAPGGKQVEPKYVTWDPHLDICEKEIERLTKHLLWEAKISPIIFPESAGQIQDSGKAIEQLLVRTLAKMSGKKAFIIPLLKKMFFDAQVLAGLKAVPVDISFTPSDIERRAREWQSIAAWQSNFQSMYQTIKNANPERSDEWIKEEIGRIIDERSQGLTADVRMQMQAMFGPTKGTPGKNVQNQKGDE